MPSIDSAHCASLRVTAWSVAFASNLRVRTETPRGDCPAGKEDYSSMLSSFLSPGSTRMNS